MQFKVFEDQVKAQEDELVAVIAGIKPVLDCVSFEPPEGTTRLPGDLPHRLILDRGQRAWTDFKEFTRSSAKGAVIHALAVLWSHYPSEKPEVIMTGYARGTNVVKITKLEDEAKEAVVKLARDVDLFGEG